MQAVHMPYRPKRKFQAQKEREILAQTSPFVSLSKTNTFSYRPCYNPDTAIAYSKGKLSAMPRVAWDDE